MIRSGTQCTGGINESRGLSSEYTENLPTRLILMDMCTFFCCYVWLIFVQKFVFGEVFIHGNLDFSGQTHLRIVNELCE